MCNWWNSHWCGHTYHSRFEPGRPRVAGYNQPPKRKDVKDLVQIPTNKKLILLPNSSPCAWRTARPNNTETSEFGADKGLLQGPARRRVAHALKTPNYLKAFSKALLQERWGRGGVSCWKLLGVRSFVLEVRSWSGHDVPVNVHQTNVSLCSDKKRQGPKAQLSPSEVQASLRGGGPCAGRSPSLGPPTSAQPGWGGRSQLVAPLRARSPDPAQPSSLREPGAQDPAGPQAAQIRGRVPRTATHGDRRCRH